MVPGEMHVRAAEANLANAMLRLVGLTGHVNLESVGTSDLASAASTPVDDEEARPAVSGIDAHDARRLPTTQASSRVGASCRLDAPQSQLARLQRTTTVAS